MIKSTHFCRSLLSTFILLSLTLSLPSCVKNHYYYDEEEEEETVPTNEDKDGNGKEGEGGEAGGDDENTSGDDNTGSGSGSADEPSGDDKYANVERYEISITQAMAAAQGIAVIEGECLPTLSGNDYSSEDTLVVEVTLSLNGGTDEVIDLDLSELTHNVTLTNSGAFTIAIGNMEPESAYCFVVSAHDQKGKPVQQLVNLTVPTLAASILNYEEPEAVDLGLSVLWADRNLGAALPGDAGDFFCYAETFTGKSSYTECNYTLYGFEAAIGNDVSGNEMFDIVAKSLPKGWRLPTEAEMIELNENCKKSQTTVTNSNKELIYCFQVTGANGNLIYLPSVGHMEGTKIVTTVEGVSSKNGAFYLSGTRGAIIQYYVVQSSSMNAKVYNIIENAPEWWGCTVRPVKDKD